MAQVGIWEAEGEFSVPLAPFLPAGTVIGNHPAAFSQQPLDLLLMAPSASGWAAINRIHCRIALLPGPFLPLTRGLKAEYAISYGTAPRSTITLSSLEREQIGIALQRSIPTLAGGTVDEQEFLLPFPTDTDPTLFLGLTGARLLLSEQP